MGASLRMFGQPKRNRARVSAILFLIFFLGTAGERASAQEPFSTAGRELANTILARASYPNAISLQVINASSLSLAEVETARHTLAAQFTSGRAQIVPPERAVAEIRITLAEDVRGYLWIAEAKHGEEREVAMVRVARAEAGSLPRMAPTISLRKTLLWSQAGSPVLDAALLDKGERLLVLDGSTLSMYRNQQSHWELEQSQPIAHSHPWPRDVRGRLVMAGDHKLEAYLPGKKCTGTANPGVSIECHDSDDPWPISADGKVRGFFGSRNFFIGALTGWKESSIPPFYAATVAPDGATLLSKGTDGWLRGGDSRLNNANGDDMAGIQSDCGNYLLVSSTGDSMTRDSVRLAELSTGTVIQQVAALEFPGAISALWDAADRGSATAVVKDLTSGRYEAYAISLSCR